MIDNNKIQQTIAEIEQIRNFENNSDKIDSMISLVRDYYVALETMNDLLAKTIEQASVLSNSIATALDHITVGFSKTDNRLNALEKYFHSN